MKNVIPFCVTVTSLSMLASTTFAGLPDNGGTADMPAHAPYLDDLTDNNTMAIIDGLPAATTISIVPILTEPASTVEVPGGSLGGTVATGTGMFFDWAMDGTGSLAGFSRQVAIPVQVQVHTAPRTPGNPVQSFDTDMFAIQGQLVGDPDFDLLRVTAGDAFGLPSPGHTTLVTDGMGAWNVDSFFDITYRIDFIGSPGSPLGGMSGSTTGTIRMVLPEPTTLSALAGVGLIALRRRNRI